MRKRLLIPYILLLLCVSVLHAQQIITPDGETVVSKRVQRQSVTLNGQPAQMTMLVCATNKHVYVSLFDDNTGSWMRAQSIYHTSFGISVNSVEIQNNTVSGQNTVRWAVLLSNGHVDHGHSSISAISGGLSVVSTTDGTTTLPGYTGGESLTKISEHYYVYSTLKLWLSKDSAATFTLDTAGLSGAAPRGVSVDNNGNSFLATTRGLYKKPAAATSWTKVDSFPVSSATLVFVDRRNTIYAVGSNRLYKSINGGNAFGVDTAGAGTLAYRSIEDDAYGNIYIVAQTAGGGGGGGTATGSRLYRRMNGTPSFSRIESPISTKNLETSNTAIFNEMGGDTVVVVSTKYGVFTTRDQGGSYVESNNGILAELGYGIPRGVNNRLFCTTTLGCFYREQGDPQWHLSFPTNSYLGGQPIYSDTSGNLFTRGAYISTNITTSTPRVVWRSIDNGNTWSPDTAGISGIGMSRWFVDETGVQHATRTGGGGPGGATLVYSKAAGGNWALDTGGLLLGTNAFVVGFGNNRHGAMFISTNALVFKHIRGGEWEFDTTGLAAEPLTSFDGTSNATVAIGQSSIRYQIGSGAWQKFGANPAGLSLSLASQIAVDDSDYVWVSFQHTDTITRASVGDGVYFTKNFGATWNKAKGSVDSLLFKQISVVGDSVYGTTTTDGIYVMHRWDAAAGAARVQLSAKRIDFDTVTVGQTKDSILTIANPGTAVLSVTDITSSSTMFGAQTKTLSVAIGMNGQTTIRFAPSALGPVSATLLVKSNAASSPDTVYVTGIGRETNLKLPILSLSSKVIDFGSVKLGNSRDTLITATNIGTDTVHVTAYTIGSTSFSSSAVPMNLAPNGSGQISIRFTPQISGAITGTMYVISNSFLGPDTVVLMGNGQVTIGVNDKNLATTGYSLEQNQPNPFSQSSVIGYTVPKSIHARITLTDARGVLVATLIDGTVESGRHELKLDASQLTAGVYFVRMNAGEYTSVQRIVVLK